MVITFLGTGTSQGVPMIGCNCVVCSSKDPHDKRLRTSILLETKDTVVVVDTGPDFRQQMLREHVQKLDAVVFTHEHKDHTAGLDDVRAFNYKQRGPMQVYATERVQAALKREFAYIFSGENYPGIPRIHFNTIGTDDFQVGEINFHPVEVMHMNLPVLGFRIGDFSYITDANFIAPAEKEKIFRSKVLVLNALRKEHHVSHFTLDEAVKLINELEPGRAYLTHISHQLGLHEEVNRGLPPNIECAFDGLKISI